MSSISPGKRFRDALYQQQPLAVAGAVNAYCALLAEQAGFQALYVSGAGVANASYGLPDLGVTERAEVLTDVRRITSATSLPVLVDVDTGWGDESGVARTVRSMEAAGVAAIHIEDQAANKRCGHRPGKQLVSIDEMVARLKASVAAKQDPDFVVMARTDAVANEGMESAIARAQTYVDAGADMLFPEALATLEDYQRFVSAVSVPVLANITEFGKTPLFSRKQLASVGVGLALYPLSAFRAMSAAAESVYQTILEDGDQRRVLDQMQTRERLYHVLDYYRFEKEENHE